MKKPLVSRILILVFTYFAVFCVLVFLQFFGRGNFTHSLGAMTVSGRYLQLPDADPQSIEQYLSGGVKVFFGGLEINLKENNEKGLMLADTDGVLTPVNPGFMILEETRAHIGLPGGTMLTFNSVDTARGTELLISAEFTENISAITIPITPRRSSLINDNGRLSVLYSGDYYFLGRTGEELENSRLVLSPGYSSISYRSTGRQRVFVPADYTIALLDDYENTLTSWRGSSFYHWSQNASLLQTEDDVVAYISEALQSGNYTAAAGSVSQDFINSREHGYSSAVFTGGMAQAYRLFSAAEHNRINTITRLTRENSPDVFLEDHVLNFLYTRSNTALANDVLNLFRSMDAENFNLEHCPGILEAWSDSRRWRSAEIDLTEQLIDRIHYLVSQNINRDNVNDLVYISHNNIIDPAENTVFSLRLGRALLQWAKAAENQEWEAVSRSLILSALTDGGIGSGNLYNTLYREEYNPRAVWLADNGLWAWTVSSSVRASNIAGNLNIAVSFLPNSTHYIMICGVRPFLKLQIHGMDWRSDSQFERYDSSGWVYYPQDQVLVLKLRHRVSVENIRIFYVEEPPPPPPPPPPVIPEDEEVTDVNAAETMSSRDFY